jgi:thiol-disulfide isomerase/thioredoxin
MRKYSDRATFLFSSFKVVKMKNKFKFLTLICFVFLICHAIFAQTGKVPPFRMVQADGKVFKAENLPFGKPIIIIYFSPDCDDCQLFISELLARINDFRKVSIAMITYLSVESVSNFVAKSKLSNYSNIYVGTEENYLLVKNYYNIEQFPFVTLYNKNGDLIKKYNSKEISVNDLSDRLKLLL